MRIPKNKAKKQHWVPFSYLKYFAIPETKRKKEPEAWILSKRKGDPRRVPVRSFSRKKYMYSPIGKTGKRSWYTEDKLHDLESFMGKIWPHFSEGLVDYAGNQTVKESLALYMSTLILRNPSEINKVQSLHRQLTDFYDSLPQDSNGNPLIGEISYRGQTIPFDSSNYSEYRCADKNDIQHMFVDDISELACSLSEMLLEKRWSIIFSDAPVFITTDNPVVIENSEQEPFGLRTKGTEVLFPINPNRLLMLDDKTHEPDGLYYPLGSDGPGPINLSLWHGAKEYMLSHRNTVEVCAEMMAWADGYETSPTENNNRKIMK